MRTVRYRGMELAVLANEDVGWRLVSQGRYESAQLDSLEPLLRPDDFCVDVGANFGVYTVFLAKRAPKGRVVAVEPIPLYRDLLRLNLAFNELANVDVLDGVMSEQEGTAEFSIASDGAFSSLRSTGRKRELGRVRVPSRRLDKVLEAAKKPAGLVKIDVEGAEFSVLRGAARALESSRLRPRAWLVELNAANQAAHGAKPADIVSFMRAHDYDAFTVTRRGPKPGWPHPGGTEEVLFRARDA